MKTSDLARYRFKINGVTPEKLPLDRLLHYLRNLPDLLGCSDIHLLDIARSSAVPVIGIPPQDAIKAERRLFAVKTHSGPIAAQAAFDKIDAGLAEDGFSATFIGPTGKLIEFPGKRKPQSERPIGPIYDEAIMDGEVVQVGGRDETISVYLRSGRDEQICTGTRSQGRDLAKFLFGRVRVFGDGTWVRNADGKWELQALQIKRFTPLADDSLSAAIEKLHAIDCEGVRAVDDATKFIDEVKRRPQ